MQEIIDLIYKNWGKLRPNLKPIIIIMIFTASLFTALTWQVTSSFYVSNINYLRDRLAFNDLVDNIEPLKKVPETESFNWPVEGKIISSFGLKGNGLSNQGINIKANLGSPVRASKDGIIAYVGEELQGYGKIILVRHEGTWMTAYAHLKEIIVSNGENVKEGETIATVGKTGIVNSPQLHFEIRKGTVALNPEFYLENKNDTNTN